MPKRLCAIALTKSQNTILAGDKFGDVYALPLFPSSQLDIMSTPKPQLALPKPFKLSASELTVHTKGNREALRQQQLQRASASKKEEPTFEHRLILGHVSLLTGLLVGIDASNSRGEYILTSDRDEHIRVSRGIPQAHVINNYCLGHTEFVSKLCMIPNRPEYLISGGGEPSLWIYDWLTGGVIAEIGLEKDLKRLLDNSSLNNLPESNERRPVSHIQALCVDGLSSQGNGQDDLIMIMVALEGYVVSIVTATAKGLR
jgi:tRNA (guanine-N(7)-)-methyltransferase subunit TRM82